MYNKNRAVPPIIYPSIYKLNQYNWFGQKLLAQQRHAEVIKLRDTLDGMRTSSSDHEFVVSNGRNLAISNHITFIGAVATLRTSFKLEEVIVTLQKLDFQSDKRYFLLLCQCLLLDGNYDAVIALFTQRLSTEIKAVASDSDGSMKSDYLDNLKDISKNVLINDSRLWFIFALSLTKQLRFFDAYSAHRIACELAAAKQIDSATQPISSTSRSGQATVDQTNPKTNQEALTPRAINDFDLPYLDYSERCLIDGARDYKAAIRGLNAAISTGSSNHLTSAKAALLACCQPSSSGVHFDRAMSTLTALDRSIEARRNPSSVYNQIALNCRVRLSDQSNNDYREINLSNLDYVLIKSHVLLNRIVQSSSQDWRAYICRCLPSKSLKDTEQTNSNSYSDIDKLITALRSVGASCSLSPAVWNNLGICYLMKRRFVASLSCLLKAQQLDPLDWRVQYNLGLVSLHISANQHSLISLIAARNYHRLKRFHSTLGQDSSRPELHIPEPFIQTLLALCLSDLTAKGDARRLFAEMIVRMKKSGNSSKIPVVPVVNYLQFLAMNKLDNYDNKLIAGLVELLERSWLQRSQNDAQYNVVLLELARLINESILAGDNSSTTRSRLAWTRD